ncbi:hypothetical protein QCA50_015528 [Cerrena zonata]|uniref:Uncharacterized protein n=1 Tax=Cerrena zonata TaxID=2478898 RepID=A0AAW0FVR7_9APHY
MSSTPETENTPITQGSTTIGRAPQSPAQEKLWMLTFMIREAVLVAPDHMEEKEAMYYFNTVYKQLKDVWNEVRTSTSGGVPYILSSFARIRVPQDQSSGSWKKDDILAMFQPDDKYKIFYDNQATFSEDLKWPGSLDMTPFWCKVVMDLNAIRARKKMPPLVLCLESHLFQTYPRFTYFSTIFRDQYLPLTAVTANREKRPRTSTDTEFEVGTNSSSKEGGSSTPLTSSTLAAPNAAMKPALKRPRIDIQEDVEMTDETSAHSEPPADRKGKGRAVDPDIPDTPAGVESSSEPEEDQDEEALMKTFMNQNVMFKAALDEQLSPIPCESCAQGGHQCFVSLRNFHGCWRCKATSNGCSLIPRKGTNAYDEPINLRNPPYWPWYISLVYHVKNVLELDTNSGPQLLPPDYADVEFPAFPADKAKKVTKRLTTLKVGEMKAEKLSLNVDNYYALPFSLYSKIEKRREEAPKWPILPDNAEALYQKVIRKAAGGRLARPWANREGDAPMRGRSRSRAATITKAPQQQPKSRRPSRARSRQAPSIETASTMTNTSMPPSTSTSTRQTRSKSRGRSQPPPSVHSTNQGSSEEEDVVSTGILKRSRSTKRPSRGMKRVPAKSDSEEETLTAFEERQEPQEEPFLRSLSADARPVAGPSGSGQNDPSKTTADGSVKIPELTVLLKSERRKTLNGVQDCLQHQHGAILHSVKLAVEGSVATVVESLEKSWSKAHREDARQNLDRLPDMLDHAIERKLSNFLQNIEKHIDQKLDRTMGELKTYIDEQMRNQSVKQLGQTKLMIEAALDNSDDDSSDEDEQDSNEFTRIAAPDTSEADGPETETTQSSIIDADGMHPIDLPKGTSGMSLCYMLPERNLAEVMNIVDFTDRIQEPESSKSSNELDTENGGDTDRPSSPAGSMERSDAPDISEADNTDQLQDEEADADAEGEQDDTEDDGGKDVQLESDSDGSGEHMEED